MSLKYFPRLSSPTTKVRRLGYLIELTKILKRGPIPARLLPYKVVEQAKENRKYLESYSSRLPVQRRKNDPVVGEITTLDAAKRYINSVREMGLIVQIANEWENTKIGNVIGALPSTPNVFELSLEQIFLLLRILLTTDYAYIKAIFEIIKEGQKVEDEAGIFQRKITAAFSAKFENIKREILGWEKPHEYYMENIKAPRLEWLLDLKIVVRWNQKLEYVQFRPNFDVFFRGDILDNTWLNERYPSAFYTCFKDLFHKPVSDWSEIQPSRKEELLGFLLEQSLERFKPIKQINKISADQFFIFSSCRLVTEFGILSSYSELEEDLLESSASGKLPYRYVRMVSEADRGYIVKR